VFRLKCIALLPDGTPNSSDILESLAEFQTLQRAIDVAQGMHADEFTSRIQNTETGEERSVREWIKNRHL